MKTTWSVAVVYQDVAAREAAVDFCDHLVERFWSQGGFDVSWWSFSLLQEALPAREAAQKIEGADLIVVAVQPQGSLDGRFQAWLETSLKRRGDREGALVGLIGAGATSSATEKHLYLRNLAHRLGLDYLTRLPQGIEHCLPESWQNYSERADQITQVLDEILHQRERSYPLP